MNPLAATLAWVPFLQPAPGADRWWWLLVFPTALGISLAYKAIRTPDLARYPRAVASMTVQILGLLVGIALGLHVIVLYLVPLLPAE